MRRALRVLHVASGDLWAGAEVQAFTLISHLSRMPETEVAAVLMNDSRLAENLRSAGVKVYIIDESQKGALGIFLSLRDLLRRWRPDVMHTHREKENILGSLGNRTCGNVPSVRTVHGWREPSGALGLLSLRRELVHSLDRWCGRVLQERIIAVSDDLAGKLTRDFPSEKIVVIENGIDLKSVALGNDIAEFRVAEPNATHIGIAGRLVDVKRVDLFLETAVLLLRECPERQWRFHIFGEGSKRSGLERLARRLRLGEAVLFHGHRQDIANCVAGLDILVICSDHEGLPMVSLEAAALAVPTVAHAAGGLLEVIPDEFLVCKHEARGYKEAVLRALRADGRDIAKRRGAEVVGRFSAQRNAERVRALYEEMVREGDGPVGSNRAASAFRLRTEN